VTAKEEVKLAGTQIGIGQTLPKEGGEGKETVCEASTVSVPRQRGLGFGSKPTRKGGYRGEALGNGDSVCPTLGQTKVRGGLLEKKGRRFGLTHERPQGGWATGNGDTM